MYSSLTTDCQPSTQRRFQSWLSAKCLRASLGIADGIRKYLKMLFHMLPIVVFSPIIFHLVFRAVWYLRLISKCYYYQISKYVICNICLYLLASSLNEWSTVHTKGRKLMFCLNIYQCLSVFRTAGKNSWNEPLEIV